MIEVSKARDNITIKNLDIGEVIIAGLIKLGYLPDPDLTRLDKYRVTIRDGHAISLGGLFSDVITRPIIEVKCG